MVSLDIESLFTNIPLEETNIPLEETIDNIINDLFLKTDKVHNFEWEKSFFSISILYLFLMENITLKLMVLLWDPLWAQHLSMLFCVTLRQNGFQNAL